MRYEDLRDFIVFLEGKGQLKRIQTPVSPYLEITEICDRVLRQQGPALLFENPTPSSIPLLGNLFGTEQRIAFAMGRESKEELRELGQFLALLKEPKPPSGFKEALQQLPLYKQLLLMAPQTVSKGKALCQKNQLKGSEIDLSQWP